MIIKSFIEYEKINFHDKKYITTIVGYKKSNELYSKRIEAIQYFQNKYDSFGVGWEKSHTLEK